MKVLWFSVTPSLYDEKKYGGWIASLERIVCNSDLNIELAVAFEYNSSQFKIEKHGTVYYPINIQRSLKDKIMGKYVDCYNWNRMYPKLLNIIDDFQPDIIQCFGSEWPYGRIAEYTDIPVAIHMQGFSNIYSESRALAFSRFEWIRCNNYNPKILFTEITNSRKNEYNKKSERYLMSINKYFMGRTTWDRNIVKYYSPNAQYFYCPEALRPEIYNSDKRWTYKHRDIYRLVTITQAGILKGNEIILRTASLLKEQFDFPFEWRVAGNPEAFKASERKTGIDHRKCNIKLLGMIDANSVACELADANAYIHPAIIDNSPNSLCEAQVIGCPVIAANVGGISDLVKNNETGLLYPYNEPHTLAFTIMSLCADRDKMEYLSRNEIACANERHDPALILQTLYNCYKTICKINSDKF